MSVGPGNVTIKNRSRAITGMVKRVQPFCRACGFEVNPGSKFCSECGTGLQPTEERAGSAAERRILTVMFCDMVGSTALSTQLDPEDFRDLIRSFRQIARGAVQRFGGMIAQYLGDGVLAYFGYPEANENDAERTIRAALEIVEAAKQWNATSKLEVRIGIATGLVVVGEQCETVNPGEKSAVGNTPPLAARLQIFAEPNEIVIAESTQRLAGRFFNVDELPPLTVKGFSAPIKAFKVLSCSPIESRFEAFRPDEPTPFIGREKEMALLSGVWERVENKNGQAVLLTGESGIGKSRLLDQLQETLGGSPHMELRYFCSPLHTQSPFFPIWSQIERDAGILPGEDRSAKLQKIERLLKRTSSNLQRDLNIAAVMLGIDEARSGGLEDDAQQKKEILFQAALDHVRALAHQGPLVAVFEDAHWIDPTSNELLERYVEEAEGSAILVLVTARPEYQPAWLEKSDVTVIPLSRLNRPESSAIIAGVTGRKALPSEVEAQILDRTDGVPLFIEESTKTILESGLLVEEADRFVLRGPMPPLAVPPSLQASLVARLDRLSAVKDIAQTGAAIGREFSYSLLEAVAALPAAELEQALSKLIAAGLLQQRGTLPDAIYTFKHTLARDAAYGTLLRIRRRQLHAVIADTLVQKFPAGAKSQPEIVAHHYAEAKLYAKAADFWLEAGKLAGGRSASSEAVVHLEMGLNSIKLVPPSPERDKSEFKLQLAIWPNLMATKGSDAPETLHAARRSRELLRPEDPFYRRLYVLGVSFLSDYNSAKYRESQAVAEELLAAAEKIGDETGLFLAHAGLAVTCNATGEFRLALHHANCALNHYTPSQYGPYSWRYMYESGVGSQCHKGLALWHLGRLDGAQAAFTAALEMAQRLNHQYTAGYAYAYAGMIPAFLASDFAGLKTYAALCHELGATHKIQQWEAWGLCLGAPACAKTGGEAEAKDMLKRGEHLRERLQNKSLKSLFLMARAAVADVTGEEVSAAGILDLALRNTEESGERWVEAELWRLKGDALLGPQSNMPAAAAESCYRRGIALAQVQEAPLYGLRNALALRSLLRQQGQKDPVTEELRRFLAAFPEQCTAPELRAARDYLSRS
jgi:class 3 adenylate cyclase/tetratricopeptide (TPR) repeat protein